MWICVLQSYMYPEDNWNHYIHIYAWVSAERAAGGWASWVTQASARGSAHAEAVCDEWGLPGQKTRAAAGDMRCWTWIYLQQQKNQLNLTSDSVCWCVCFWCGTDKCVVKVILKVISTQTFNPAPNPRESAHKHRPAGAKNAFAHQCLNLDLTYLERQIGGMHKATDADDIPVARCVRWPTDQAPKNTGLSPIFCLCHK